MEQFGKKWKKEEYFGEVSFQPYADVCVCVCVFKRARDRELIMTDL